MSLDSIATLETTGLIHLVQIHPELEYLFRHALVQEAAYDSILKSDRRKLHLAVAHEMERLYPDRMDELSALLANHYREAGETPKAYLYYRRAGRYAFDKYANIESEYNLRSALEFASTDEELVDTNIRLGFVLTALGKLEEAEKTFWAVLPVLRKANDLDHIALVYGQIAQCVWGRNDMAGYLAVSLEGVKEVGDLPPSENYADLLRYLTGAYVFNGMLDEAELLAAKALACAEQANAKNALAQILATQGLIDGHRGRYHQAIANYERAISVAEEIRDTYALSRARNNLATVLISLGRNLEAAQQIEMTVKMVHEINSIFGEIWFLSQLSGMYLDQGRIKEAEALLPPMQAALEASGGKAYRVQARSAWLQADLYKGNLESSMPGLSSEKQTAIENNDKQQVIAFSFSLALGYWLERDYTRAASELQFGIDQAGIWAGPNYKYLLASLLARSESATSKAREMFDQADAQALGREGVVPTYEQETNRHYALMHIYAREGNSPEALNHASIAVQRYRDAHLRWLYAHVLCEYGDIALEAKDAAKARELYNLSLAEFEVMQAPIFVDRVREKIRQVL